MKTINYSNQFIYNILIFTFQQPMEIEEPQTESTIVNEPSSDQNPRETVTEPLPNVVHGSQPWHSQVPAVS